MHAIIWFAFFMFWGVVAYIAWQIQIPHAWLFRLTELIVIGMAIKCFWDIKDQLK